MNTKTILTAISAAFVAGAAMAAPTSQSVINPRAAIGIEKGLTLKGDTFTSITRTMPGSRFNAPAKEGYTTTVTPVITEAQGVNKVYSKSCGGFYLYYGSSLGSYDAEDMNAEIVYGENNEVFFKNIISTASGTNSYVKGTLEGNKITVELPQTVMWIEDDPEYGSYGINLDVMHYQVDPSTGQFYYYHDAEKLSVTYEITSDGVITMEDLGEEMMIGYSYTDDGSFCGYGDTYQVYYPMDNLMNTIPEGVTLTENTIISGGYGYLLNVGVNGDKVYFKGMVKSMPEGVVIGDLKDGKVYIKQGQNVGVYNAYLLQTFMGVENPAYNPYDEYSDEPEFLTREGDFVLNYDAAKNTFTCDNKDLFLLFGVELAEDYYYYTFANSNFTVAPHTTYAGTPMTPYDLGYYEIMDFGGYNAILFNLPNVSVEGDLLDTKYLFYTVYVDGVAYKFRNMGQAYQGIPAGEQWTELPYDFSNENDIYAWNDLEREIDFYFGDVKTVAVRSFYRYNGVETKSQVINFNVATGGTTITEEVDGVETIAAENVARIEYFDLNGQRVSNPEKGVFVKRIVSVDGRVVVVKVIR